RGGELTFYYRAAALNHVYRFITEQTLRHGGFSFEPRTRIAFFPGTFDPFTLSHKGIVREIRDLGFEVLLALDEFSWSKKTQPRLIRRQIVTMSVADEFHVHLFPDDFPVNLANPADLRRLREAFPGRDIYMVVGSDVVANASSYQAPPTPDSIHHMNHIVFAREGCPQEGGAPNDTPLSRIDGELLRLKLPLHLEEISSTRIRENIDLNRDISNLIDPAAQEFIYANGLYLREPQDKPVLRALAVSFDWVERPDSALLDELAASVLLEHPDRARILASLRAHGDRLAVIRSGEPQRHPVGFASLRELGSADLFFELQSAAQADAVRRCAAGKILLLTGLYAAHGSGLGEIEPLLLTEVLADALVRDCVCALFHPVAADCPSRVLRALERQGFVRLSAPSDARLLLTVDLRAPIVLIQNLETTLKEPFCSNARVLAAGTAAHHRLQTAITGLCPGSLVLSLSAEIIHHRLVDKITALNAVPSIPVTGGPLGPAMCVPFGKILRGKAVPNTVTKTLHTDKVYEPDLRTSRIEAFPYYSPLETQIRTIKSFARPVILVDDLLHAGDRMLALDPLFRQEKLDVHAVLVGLLSGRGRDLMAIAGRPVDSVYFVSNLRQWFVESTLYPFIGGDTVRRAAMPVSGLQASINQILPYAAPKLADDCPPRAVFELSLVCIENARDILLALEAEYRTLFGRNLTLSRLSEAVILPLVPDKGGCIAYDPHLAASVYLENDLELLLRTQK
ncbi:MAG: cytidyltransferase-related domain protein, partial [Oscillospiraceae bacterium]